MKAVRDRAKALGQQTHNGITNTRLFCAVQLQRGVRATQRGLHEARRYVKMWSLMAVKVAKKTAVIYAMVLALVLLVCLLVLLSAGLSMASAGTLRHLLIRNVPGNHLSELSFSALPLYTELWRHSQMDEHLLPSVMRGGHGMMEPSSSSSAATSSALRPAVADHLGTGTTDLKLDFVSGFLRSILATSTHIIPSAAAHSAFLPHGGGVNLHGLFRVDEPPMFHSRGEYAGRLQLVLLRESSARDISLVVDCTMLFSEESDTPVALASLDVLFQTSNTVTVLTNDRDVLWPIAWARWVLRMIFIVPITMVEWVASYTAAPSPFTPVDAHRYVAIEVDVYAHFFPPQELQPRLRAMNFTVYQRLDHPQDSKVRLAQLNFFSSVRLFGLARLFVAYPVMSFAITSSIFFGCYLFVSVVGVGVLCLAIYTKYASTLEEGFGGDENEDEEDDLASSPDVLRRSVSSSSHIQLPSSGAFELRDVRRTSSSAYQRSSSAGDKKLQ